MTDNTKTIQEPSYPLDVYPEPGQDVFEAIDVERPGIMDRIGGWIGKRVAKYESKQEGK